VAFNTAEGGVAVTREFLRRAKGSKTETRTEGDRRNRDTLRVLPVVEVLGGATFQQCPVRERRQKGSEIGKPKVQKKATMMGGGVLVDLKSKGGGQGGRGRRRRFHGGEEKDRGGRGQDGGVRGWWVWLCSYLTQEIQG